MLKNKNHNKKILFCHIGQHKTGTTSIQNLLTKISLNHDIYIPNKFLKTEKTNISHHCIAWYFYKDDRYNLKGFKFNILDLKKEISDKKKIFISSEDISLLLSNLEAKKNFENFFKDFKIVYISFIRNTDDKHISLVRELTSYKSLNKFYRKFLQLKYFYDLFNKGFLSSKYLKSKYKVKFYTDHKKYVLSLMKNSRGKFYFFSYDKNTDIIDEFYKMGFIDYQNKKNRLNTRKKNYKLHFYSFFKNKIFLSNKNNYKKHKIREILLKKNPQRFLSEGF